jgi:hypothetical protein
MSCKEVCPVVRIPSLTHRSSTVDEDNRPVSPSETTVVRDRRATDGRPDVVERTRPEVAEHARPEVAEHARPEVAERVVARPRPRSSGLATLGLIVGVLAAAAVATGVLAALGVALGVVAVLFGIGGVSATGREYVAGRSEALFTVVLGLAAVVFGIMALTDTLSWLSSDTNQVSRLRDWLYDQMPWLGDL